MSTLNKAQAEAVNFTSGPLLIVAGAGTGKTTVVTEKIKKLIQSGVSPHEVVALTFTEKAAAEMVERLDEVMPYGYQEPWVCTFHKFCDRILKYEALEIGLDPSYQILTRPQQWLLLKKHLFSLELDYYRPLGNPNKFINALLTVFSRASDEDIHPQEIMEYAHSQAQKDLTPEEKENTQKLLEVAKAYQRYQELKIEQNALDFGDLILYCLKLFRTRPSILKKYKDQFKHILVDEFQDTNYAQYQLVKLLCPPTENCPLTVVGDDSQSIYRFRGAAISNILNFMEDYNQAHQVVLTKNYRSYQPILDGAYRLIQHNNPETLEVRLGIDKNLKSQRESKKAPEPVIIEAANEAEEVEFVVKTIYELLSKHSFTYKDFAIITRSNAQLEPYVTALKQQSIPYRRIGNRGLFDQPEVTSLIHFLTVLANPYDSIALFQLLYHPIFALKGSLILEMLRKAKSQSTSLWEQIRSQPEFETVVALITEAQEKAVKTKPSRLLFEFIESSGYLRTYLQEESLENNLRIKNINLFFSYVQSLERVRQDYTITELIQELQDLIEAGENPSQAEMEDVDAITLTTVHSAKGLEFEVVFVPSLIAGRFPTYNRRDPIELPDAVLKEQLPQADNTAEERRLFYVAITRAKDYLYLSWAKDYGGSRQRKPSGFTKETGFPTKVYVPESQLSWLYVKPNQAPVITLGSEGKTQLSFTSYSQISTFKTCPLKFKYKYVLKIPAEPTHALSFGKSIHETLKDFHLLETAGVPVDLESIYSLFEKHFIHEGYESEEHKKQRFEAGKQSLANYVAHYQSLFGKPWKLEHSFRLSIGGIPFIGTIDRIDQTPSGYELVDYKTGSAKEKKLVDKDEQLSIYALAAREALNINVDKMSLYFIEDNQKVETTRTQEQLDEKREDLAQTVLQIKESDFPAKPGNPFPCGFCEYRRICPYSAVKS